MPRLSKATVLDKWLDNFSDMNLDDQAFALAQVQAIHRQAQRQKERLIPLKVAEPGDDLPFDVTHGIDCEKKVHDQKRTGYLHAEDDDRPYDVDGVLYCGRCHTALPK